MIHPRSTERFSRMALMVAGDFSLAAASVAAAVYVRHTIPIPFTRSLLPAEKFPMDASVLLLFGASFVVALALSGFYRLRARSRARPILLIALLIQLALIAIGATLLEKALPRTIMVAVPMMEGLVFSLWRAVLLVLWPMRPRATILVGDPSEVAAALAVLEGARDHRIHVIGYAARNPAEVEARWLGPLENPDVRVAVREAEEVICLSSETGPRGRLDLLRIRGPQGFLLLASSADALLTSSVLGWMGDEPLIEVLIGCGQGVRSMVKRTADIAGAIVLMVVSTPLWIAVATALLFDDGRPILLRQLRLGRNSVPFGMWKFRTMRVEVAGSEKQSDAERHTRAGRLLRRYRLDEIPQLINVITGDMSLVGPRPERPEIAERILEEVPDFDLRCLVRPGIAGLAQILAEYDSRPAVKLRYDLTYMCSWSLWLDVQLLFSSVAIA
ncbi:MAG: sugar transferase, partial [Acidobacteriota bacterium]